MSNDERLLKGQPGGGQFTEKKYTEDDVTLLDIARHNAGRAASALQRQSLLLQAKYIGTSVLVQYPNAATISLVESDQDGSSWADEEISDADGNHVAHSLDLDLAPDFWDMPSRTPEIGVVGADGVVDSVPDPEFAWITITHDRRRGSSAVFDVRAAAAIGDATDQETTA
jgi:hypothetical protein